jgi:hypothetical protein
MEELDHGNFAEDLKIAAMAIYRIDNKIVFPFFLSTDLQTVQKDIVGAVAFFPPNLKEKANAAFKKFAQLMQKMEQLENTIEQIFPKQELGNIITTKKYSEALLKWSGDFNGVLKKLKNALAPIYLSYCGDKPADRVCPIFQNETSQIRLLKKAAYSLSIDDVSTARNSLMQLPSLGWGKLVQEKSYSTLREWFDRDTAWYNASRKKQTFLPPSIHSLYSGLAALPSKRIRQSEPYPQEIAAIEKHIELLQKRLKEELPVFTTATESGIAILDEFFEKTKGRLNEGPRIWEVNTD